MSACPDMEWSLFPPPLQLYIGGGFNPPLESRVDKMILLMIPLFILLDHFSTDTGYHTFPNEPIKHLLHGIWW